MRYLITKFEGILKNFTTFQKFLGFQKKLKGYILQGISTDFKGFTKFGEFYRDFRELQHIPRVSNISEWISTVFIIGF